MKIHLLKYFREWDMRPRSMAVFLLFSSVLLTNCATPSPKETRSFQTLVKEANEGPAEDKAEIEYDETGYVSWYGEQFQNKPTASGEMFDKNKLTGAHRSLPFGSEIKVINLENQKEAVIRINDRGPFNKARIVDVTEKVAEILDFKNSGLAKVGIMLLQKSNSKVVKDDDFNLDDDDDDDDDEVIITKPPKKEEPQKKGKEVPPPLSKKPTVIPPSTKEVKETKEGKEHKEQKESREPSKSSSSTASVMDIQPKGFCVQIGVFKEKKRADSLKAELKNIVAEPIFLFMRDTNFVMQIGDFNNREDAVALRDKLKLKGYFSFIPPK
jgi:rare lipoprotein A